MLESVHSRFSFKENLDFKWFIHRISKPEGKLIKELEYLE
jgi:hypothetical protein